MALVVLPGPPLVLDLPDDVGALDAERPLEELPPPDMPELDVAPVVPPPPQPAAAAVITIEKHAPRTLTSRLYANAPGSPQAALRPIECRTPVTVV